MLVHFQRKNIEVMPLYLLFCHKTHGLVVYWMKRNLTNDQKQKRLFHCLNHGHGEEHLITSIKMVNMKNGVEDLFTSSQILRYR